MPTRIGWPDSGCVATGRGRASSLSAPSRSIASGGAPGGREGRFGVAAGCHQLAGVAALRIVRAADEGAELPEPQRELAVAAARAGAGLRAVGARREDVRRQQIVEGIEDLGGAQLLG